LTANDRSAPRFKRLKSVLRSHTSAEQQQCVRLTRHDGRRFGRAEPEAYDAVLVDAPCSSERHVLAAPRELQKWSPTRSGRLKKDQQALLLSAMRSCKKGGRVVYATCALEPRENDAVIAWLLNKALVRVVPPPIPLPLAEQTTHGWQYLPDRSGLGPIYLCCLVKG
jgi:16S rRNA C967 or C1407 C5-methylase (RsmB/RsmF family)